MKKDNRKTLREAVYGTLKAMIVTGQVAAGARLTEIEIANKLGVSRTPVREAFNRLERDGLLAGRPRHGYVVNQFDEVMFKEAFEVREVLDGLAAELATDRATEADKHHLNTILDNCEHLAALADRTTKDQFQELQIGLELHRVIAEIAGNRMLHGYVSGILDKCQIYVWTELLWLDEWEVTRKEHRGIVDAICAGNRELAGERARNHVRGSLTNTLRLLKAKSGFREHGWSDAHPTLGK